MNGITKVVMYAALVVGTACVDAFAGSLLQIRDSIRNIERLQDATTQGDTSAMELYSKLMHQIEADISTATAEQLSDSQNAKAIAVFLLSGGNPNAVEKAFRNIKLEDGDSLLLEGALAYANGNKEKAVRVLTKLDQSEFPPNVVGRLNLILAALLGDSDFPSAISKLLKASAIMHGTIVDEASLRRCVSFASKINDIVNFENCASSYMRQFSQSLYWDDFVSNFETESALIDDKKTLYFASWLVPTLHELPVSVEVDILLEIAKNAVPIGNLILANKCASRAALLADDASVSKDRAQLYVAASMLGLNEVALAKLRLNSIQNASLVGDDLELYRKVTAILKQIHGPAAAVDQSLALPEDASTKPFDDLVAKAKLALGEIDPNEMSLSQ